MLRMAIFVWSPRGIFSIAFSGYFANRFSAEVVFGDFACGA